MNDLYVLCNITKQSHLQAVKELATQAQKVPLYINLIIEARSIHPVMGLRNIYETFIPQHIGRDAFILLGQNHGFQLEQRKSATRTTFSVKSSRYRNLLTDKVFTDVNQLWTSDLTYFALNDKFYYIVFIMDVYSRRIIGYSVADNMRAENNLKALNMALRIRGIKNYNQKLIHHSDKGSQYIADDYTNRLTQKGILISMCNVVYENTHIERVNGIIKNDYLAHYSIKNFKDLEKGVNNAVNIYNTLRPHSALNRCTPSAFENKLDDVPFMKRTLLSIFTSKQNVVFSTQLALNL
jgi:putative transposase